MAEIELQRELKDVGVNSLEADYVLVKKDDAKHGTVYIEGRILDGVFCDTTKQLQSDIEDRLSSSILTFEVGDDILANARAASDTLGKIYTDTIEFIQSLIVVEYVGPKVESSCFQLSKVRVKVQVYHMYSDGRTLQENRELPQAEITSLPHLRFEGKWNDLVFDHDIKSELIWMMSNILRFSAHEYDVVSDMNPLILLHGPPGSGKTTLCQGLAQKISIRLSDRYNETKLVEIKTATLLSKFFSESAKKVEEIFINICRMCEEDDETFICVLIDEVESIASSRERVTKSGEVQDSLRATNALLTGIDRSKGYPNVMFLCTSNFLDALDSAFLDRCGIRQAVDSPSSRSQYAILRGRLQGLMDRAIIQPKVTISSFDDAKIDLGVGETCGAKLLQIIEHIRAVNAEKENRLEISGRALTQLPESAIMRYLREEDCDLDMALNFIQQSVLAGQCQKFKRSDELSSTISPTAKAYEDTDIRNRKRKLTILLEEKGDEDVWKEIFNLCNSKNVVKVEEAEEFE